MNFIILCCAGAVCLNMLAYLCLCVDAHVCVYLCFVQLSNNRPRGWTGVTRATQLSDVGLNLLRRRGATKANNGLYYYSGFCGQVAQNDKCYPHHSRSPVRASF